MSLGKKTFKINYSNISPEVARKARFSTMTSKKFYNHSANKKKEKAG